HGLLEDEATVSEEAIRRVIRDHTREGRGDRRVVDHRAVDHDHGAGRALAQAPGTVAQWVKEPGEPTTDDVASCAQALADAGADAIVAIGGGSAMDTAKAARLVHGSGRPYADWAAGAAQHADWPTLFITVPTTSGTGSEVSGGIVVTDSESHLKAGIAHPTVRARYAIVDPELTHGLPPAPTMYAGVDAIAQAIAAVAVVARTPIGNGIAFESIRYGVEALPTAIANGADAGARSRMAACSLLGGLCMNISDCGSEHSIAQAIGGRYGLPHGLTIGLVLAETMDVDRTAEPALFDRIADAMGWPDAGRGDGSRAVAAVHALLREIGFPTLRSTGVEEDALPALAEAAMEDYFITVAPHRWTAADVLGAYRAAWAIEER
ncbi:MAG: iron-containing alcohol dehydrogenase, partial [Actinomycetota bacterium]